MQKYQSIPKIDEGFAPVNQDSVAADANYCALSDGAGGAGFVNQHWSRYLCDSLSETPFENIADFENWYEKVRNVFFEKHLVTVNEKQIERYKKQGSYATLVAAWHVGEQELQVLSYGDSGLFLLDKTGKMKCRNIKNLLEFTESPYLLNSVQPALAQALLFEKWTIESGDTLVLASDAVSQWVLIQYLLRKAKTDEAAKAEIMAVLASPYNLGNLVENCEKNLSTDSFLDILQKMESCLANENTFKACCYDKYNKQEIANDDYTLLLWRFE